MGIQPSPWAPAAFLLDLNAWLTEYRVALVSPLPPLPASARWLTVAGNWPGRGDA